MKGRLLGSIAIFTLFAGVGVQGSALARSAPRVALAKLAGRWAGYGTATFAVCFNADFSALADCTSAPNAAFFTQTSVFQLTIDTNGNSCITDTVTNSPEFPTAPPPPTNVLTFIEVGTVTSYDPATGIAQQSTTNYLAGSGTSCNGSTLVNTGNAPIAATATGTYVISQHGTRSDGVVTSLQNQPVSDVADFVGHTVAFKQ